MALSVPESAELTYRGTPYTHIAPTVARTPGA